MGFMDELKRLAHPNEDEEAFAEEAEGETYEEQPRERASHSPSASWEDSGSYSGSYSGMMDTPRGADNVVNINATTQLQVVLVKPVEFEEASNIANHLRDKRTVVLNLESANKEISRRMVDFLSGVAYALEGKIKKVAISTYIITPYNVDIIGDVLDELESSGVRF